MDQRHARGNAVSRNHRKPGVGIICTDSRHGDTPEFSQRGHHHIGAFRIRDGQLTWGGPLPDISGAGIQVDGKPTLVMDGIRPALPVTRYRHADGQQVYQFSCPCGRNPRIAEAALTAMVRRAMEENPHASYVALDITTM